MVVSLHPENLRLAACVEELQSIRESSASYVHVSDTNVLQAECMRRIDQGCSPKKEVGGRLKQELDKDFKQFRPTYTFTHTRQKNCHSGSLVLSCDTATRV